MKINSNWWNTFIKKKKIFGREWRCKILGQLFLSEFSAYLTSLACVLDEKQKLISSHQSCNANMILNGKPILLTWRYSLFVAVSAQLVYVCWRYLLIMYINIYGLRDIRNVNIILCDYLILTLNKQLCYNELITIF